MDISPNTAAFSALSKVFRRDTPWGNHFQSARGGQRSLVWTVLKRCLEVLTSMASNGRDVSNEKATAFSIALSEQGYAPR